jgi:hypothetical protein
MSLPRLAAIALLCAIAIGFVLGMGCCMSVRVAGAQEHKHPPEHVQLHDRFYRTWMRPDMPHVSCCSDKDCYPTKARFVNGHWQALRREDGVWLDVPDEKVERNRDNPDGQAHLCAPPPESAMLYKNGVICFSAGAGI